MITIMLFALTAGIVGLYFELPILETIRQRPFDFLSVIFYVFPLCAAAGGSVIGYCVAHLISLGCLKTLEEIEAITLEPIMIGGHLYYLLKRRGPVCATLISFSKDQSGKNVINELSVAKWVKIKEEDRKGAMLKVLKKVFVQPKLKLIARLSSQRTYIISVPKNTIFDGTTQ